LAFLNAKFHKTGIFQTCLALEISVWHFPKNLAFFGIFQKYLAFKKCIWHFPENLAFFWHFWRKIGKKRVKIDIFGQKLSFWSPDFLGGGGKNSENLAFFWHFYHPKSLPFKNAKNVKFGILLPEKPGNTGPEQQT